MTKLTHFESMKMKIKKYTSEMEKFITEPNDEA